MMSLKHNVYENFIISRNCMHEKCNLVLYILLRLIITNLSKNFKYKYKFTKKTKRKISYKLININSVRTLIHPYEILVLYV